MIQVFLGFVIFLLLWQIFLYALYHIANKIFCIMINYTIINGTDKQNKKLTNLLRGL